MAVFYFTAKDTTNRIITESYRANTIEELRAYMEARGLTPVSIFESTRKSIWEISTISDRSILLFTRYFASLVKAGISAYKSINMLARQEKNHYLREKLEVVTNDIKNGSNLFDSFSRFKNIFGGVYLGLLRTGEEAGRLYDLLEKAADLLEGKIAMKRKIVSVISYPLIIIFLILVLVFVIFMQIVPKFQTLYGQMGLTLDDLPLITKVVISVAEFVRNNFFIELGSVVFFFGALYQIYSSERGKLFIDRLLIKIPFVKDIIIKYFMARFARNLSVLFESGFSIIVAFERSEAIVSNMAVKEQLHEVVNNLERGSTISEAFYKVPIVPDITCEMIAIGEQTASFDKMLNNVADFYEKDLDYMIETFMNWLEPSIIIILGLIVGIILLAVYLPVFALAAKVKINV